MPEPAVFYGDNLTKHDYDTLAVKHVEGARFFSMESDLFETKWFDYRAMHPTKATFLYAHHYVEAYKKQVKVRIDIGRGEGIKPFKKFQGDIFELTSRNLHSLWKGRQAADKLGVPYYLYTNYVMLKAEEANWRYFPRPQHMYSTEMQDCVLEQWSAETSARIVLPESAEFLLENYTGTNAQDDFRQYLVDVVRSRETPVFLLSRLMDDGYIDEAFVEEEFGDRVLESCKYISDE